MRDNKCNAFTSLEQSRKLAEILPIESADMYWDNSDTGGRSYTIHIGKSIAIERNFLSYKLGGQICAWSLAALLNFLSNYQLQTQDDGIGILCFCNGKFNIVTADNPVDACVEMIIKLKELNLL